MNCLSSDCMKVLRGVNYSTYRIRLRQPPLEYERAELRVTVATNIWETGSYSGHLIWSLFQSDICFCLFVKTHLFQLNLHNKKYNDQL